MKTMSECRKKDTAITWSVIGGHAFMTAFISLLLTAITGMPLIGIPLGVLIWTLVLFMTPLFDWTFFNTKPNWAIIVGNQLVWDEVPEDPNHRIHYEEFPLNSMREVGPGIRGKLPQEVIYEPINLQSELVIGNKGQKDRLLQCYTSEDIPLLIEWQVILTPLRGYLVNMVRKGDEASAAFFQGEFEQAIIQWVKIHTEEEVFKSLDHLKDVFQKVFGGSKSVDPREEEYGIFTNTPQIISVNRTKRYADAAEGVKMGAKVATIAGEINGKFGDQKPDPNMVLATASALAGIEVDGLVLIPGLSGNTPAVAALLAARKGGQITNKKKGGTP